MFNYWMPLYQRIARMLSENPKMSRKEAASKCGAIKRTAWFKTNIPTAYCSGQQEKAKRRKQIEKGLIQVSC